MPGSLGQGQRAQSKVPRKPGRALGAGTGLLGGCSGPVVGFGMFLQDGGCPGVVRGRHGCGLLVPVACKITCSPICC